MLSASGALEMDALPVGPILVGVAKPGYMVNTLTPVVGDANTQTPEYKSFLVTIEKA